MIKTVGSKLLSFFSLNNVYLDVDNVFLAETNMYKNMPFCWGFSLGKLFWINIGLKKMYQNNGT